MNGSTREKRFCRAVLFGEAPDAPETPNAGEPAGEPRAHAGAEAAAAQADADLAKRDRAAAEAVRALFRRELAAPPFDRAKLLKAMQERAAAAPASPAPFSIVERPRARVWSFAAVAALLAVAAGVAWVLLRSPDGTDFATQPPEPAPPPGPRLVAERLPDGRWRYGEAATLTPRDGTRVQASDDGVMDLRAGRAELVCDGQARARVEVLAALDGNVRVSLLGPSRSGLRVLPGGRGLAFSVYEGARNSVLVMPRAKWPPEVLVGRDVDGIVFLDSAPKGFRLALWPDVTAALPPATPGDVYLRLANGSIVRGRVTARTEESVQVLGARTPVPEAGPGTDPAPGAEMPETFLAREVAAWTPAETPRGRDTYARWLDECASAQLLDARRAWLLYLTEADAGLEHERQPAEFLASQRPLPETPLRLARRGDEPVLQLVPQDPDLGPGWEMNTRGEVTRIAPDAPVKGQEF